MKAWYFVYSAAVIVLLSSAGGEASLASGCKDCTEPSVSSLRTLREVDHPARHVDLEANCVQDALPALSKVEEVACCCVSTYGCLEDLIASYGKSQRWVLL